MPPTLRGSLSLFLLVLGLVVFVVLVDSFFDLGQFQWLYADHFVFGSTLVAGDHVAFFDLFYVNIKIVFAFRAACHGSLLSPGV